MIAIRPVSDLRNKFSEIEALTESDKPVFLTKNGYGTMVVLSIARYSELTDNVERSLDEADWFAKVNKTVYSADEVFGRAKGRIHAKAKAHT